MRRVTHPWQLTRARQEVRTVLNTFEEWKIMHTYRERNQAADYLASWRSIPGRSYFRQSTRDGKLNDNVSSDAAGTKWPIKLLEPPSVSVGMLEVFGGGAYSVVRHNLVSGNGFVGAEN
ncbi:hypothetical protein QJS10_CPA16g00639 [Acorus calamus]|uniref:RNase H type-1 domain-containing protein n=1 Tax=Acorus calamus TaxID=4465 RepID=A0AAV9CZV6_ACOCL|nr:hypothetical protein QJS10_CPA16g00639 [Acorus calamus]